MILWLASYFNPDDQKKSEKLLDIKNKNIIEILLKMK